MVFPSGSVVKNPPANSGDAGLLPGSRRSPRGGCGASASSILAWEIPWTEEPGNYSSCSHRGVGHDLVTKQQPSCRNKPLQISEPDFPHLLIKRGEFSKIKDAPTILCHETLHERSGDKTAKIDSLLLIRGGVLKYLPSHFITQELWGTHIGYFWTGSVLNSLDSSSLIIPWFYDSLKRERKVVKNYTHSVTKWTGEMPGM